MENNVFFNFISPFLAKIDSGSFFRKPFKWIYALIAVVNVILPLYLLYLIFDSQILRMVNFWGCVLVFVLWIIVAGVSWLSFQLWWDRKDKLEDTGLTDDRFVATPVFSHFIQTMGEFTGMWIGVVGFFGSLVITIAGTSNSAIGFMLSNAELGFIGSGIGSMIAAPVYGFLIIVLTRFIAESFRALASIAINTRK